VGLSFAFGAFVAGMVLSESEHSHQALSDITPLRDLFGLLFFVSVGMLLDPAFLLAHLTTVLVVVLLVALGKSLIFGLLTWLFGYGNVVPFAVALGLFQVGEFSFVVARVGMQVGAIEPDLYALVLTVAVVTMVLTPLVSQLVTPLYAVRTRWFKAEPLQTMNVPQAGLRQHVVIAGAGGVGQYVARVLQRLQLTFVVIELEQERLEACQQLQLPVIYGDASHPTVLAAAAIAQARLLVITTTPITVTQLVVNNVRQLHPSLHIVARAEGVEQMILLHQLGVYEVVQPEFEAGLEITQQALLHLDIPAGEIQHFTDAVRHELYAPLYQVQAE
jgi:CPA2 family monovalent cation:H+ antiporter-2